MVAPWWNSLLNAGERETLAVQEETVFFFGEPWLMELLLMLLTFHGQFVLNRWLMTIFKACQGGSEDSLPSVLD